MFNLGFSEILVIAVIALIFIGPKQLPDVARAVGRLINEWKRATSDLTSSFKDNDAFRDWEERKQKFFSERDEAEKTDEPEIGSETEHEPIPSETAQLELNLDQENSKNESE